MSNINKSPEDIVDILNSVKAAMEAVGLPMDKFVAYNEAKSPVLFTRFGSKKPVETGPAQGQKAKI